MGRLGQDLRGKIAVWTEMRGISKDSGAKIFENRRTGSRSVLPMSGRADARPYGLRYGLYRSSLVSPHPIPLSSLCVSSLCAPHV